MFDTQTLNNIFDMAYSMPMAGVIAMLWFTLAFEVPRYAMTYIPALILIWRGRSVHKRLCRMSGVSQFWWRGTMRPMPLKNVSAHCKSRPSVISKLSVYRMVQRMRLSQIMARLQREGLVDKVSGVPD